MDNHGKKHILGTALCTCYCYTQRTRDEYILRASWRSLPSLLYLHWLILQRPCSVSHGHHFKNVLRQCCSIRRKAVLFLENISTLTYTRFANLYLQKDDLWYQLIRFSLPDEQVSSLQNQRNRYKTWPKGKSRIKAES